MKNKLFILFLSIFLLTGCKVTYDLNVEDFTENITVYPSNEEELDYLNHYTMDDPAFYTDSDKPDDFETDDDIEYYRYDISSDKLRAFYTFKDNYSLSNASNYCFPTLVVLKGANIRLNTTSKVECFNYEPNLESITINITVPYNVVDHNADSVDGNVYTWVFEREGSMKSINIEYNNPDYKTADQNSGNSGSNKNNNNGSRSSNTNSNKKEKKDNSKYAYLLTGLFFALLFVIIFFRNKIKKY